MTIGSQSILALREGAKLKTSDAELLVFNPMSWETHLLNEHGALIVAMFAGGPQTLEQIQRAYRLAQPDDEPSDSSDAAVVSLLTQLCRLGLIRQDPPAARDADW